MQRGASLENRQSLGWRAKTLKALKRTGEQVVDFSSSAVIERPSQAVQSPSLSNCHIVQLILPSSRWFVGSECQNYHPSFSYASCHSCPSQGSYPTEGKDVAEQLRLSGKICGQHSPNLKVPTMKAYKPGYFTIVQCANCAPFYLPWAVPSSALTFSFVSGFRSRSGLGYLGVSNQSCRWSVCAVRPCAPEGAEETAT